MIEIRNDEIAGEEGQRKWAALLAEAIAEVERSPNLQAVRG